MLVTLAIQLPKLVASLASASSAPSAVAIDISSLVQHKQLLHRTLVCTVNCVHSDLVNRCTCTFHGTFMLFPC